MKCSVTKRDFPLLCFIFFSLGGAPFFLEPIRPRPFSHYHVHEWQLSESDL